MADLKDNAYAVDTIAFESIGYAVQDYCGASTFEDPVTATLWAEACIALGRLENHLVKGDTSGELQDRTADVERAEAELEEIAAR